MLLVFQFVNLKQMKFNSVMIFSNFMSLNQSDFENMLIKDSKLHQYYLSYCSNFTLKIQIFIFI
jgi:hypothetical protein